MGLQPLVKGRVRSRTGVDRICNKCCVRPILTFVACYAMLNLVAVLVSAWRT